MGQPAKGLESAQSFPMRVMAPLWASSRVEAGFQINDLRKVDRRMLALTDQITARRKKPLVV